MTFAPFGWEFLCLTTGGEGNKYIMNIKMEENQRVKWWGKDTTRQLLTDADKLCCNLSAVLGNDGFLVAFFLLFSSWRIIHWCYTNSVSLPFVYKVGQSGFSLGEPLSWICRWQMWIVLSIWSWEDLCSFKDSCLTCIDSSFKAHFLISCAWFPGTHVFDKVKFPDHTFCFHLKIYSLAPPPGFWSMERRILRNNRLKKRSEVFIPVYKC